VLFGVSCDTTEDFPKANTSFLAARARLYVLVHLLLPEGILTHVCSDVGRYSRLIDVPVLFLIVSCVTLLSIELFLCVQFVKEASGLAEH